MWLTTRHTRVASRARKMSLIVLVGVVLRESSERVARVGWIEGRRVGITERVGVVIV